MSTPSIQSLVEAYQKVYSVDEGYKSPNVGKMRDQAQKHHHFSAGIGSPTAYKRGPNGEDPSTVAIRRGNKMGEVMADPKFDRYQPAKKQVTKEEVIQYLMDEGFVNNEASAEVFIEHMSDEWLDDIIEGYKKLPAEKMEKQAKSKMDKAWGAPLFDRPKIKKAAKQVNKMGKVAGQSGQDALSKKLKDTAKGRIELPEEVTNN
jgi:hypothetical protein